MENVLHKISKNGLEVRKSQPLEVGGLFLRKLSMEQLITLIILCSEMLKSSKLTCFQRKKILKENKESDAIVENVPFVEMASSELIN